VNVAAPAREYHATLERVTVWTTTTRSLFLRFAADRTLPYDPGQFVSLVLPVGGLPPLVRAYSLASSSDDGGLLELCVDRVADGVGSAYLCGLAPGASLVLRGPFGSFKLAEPPDAEMVFIAAGTGIAPIRPMVQRAVARGGRRPITVLQGGYTDDVLLFGDELAALAATEPRVRWEPVLTAAGTPATEHPALETCVVERFIDADQDRSRHFWICAVGALAPRLRDCLRAAGYERRAVRCERW
jgi:ferredoxin-NADP reductase